MSDSENVKEILTKSLDYLHKFGKPEDRAPIMWTGSGDSFITGLIKSFGAVRYFGPTYLALMRNTSLDINAAVLTEACSYYKTKVYYLSDLVADHGPTMSKVIEILNSVIEKNLDSYCED